MDKKTYGFQRKRVTAYEKITNDLELMETLVGNLWRMRAIRLVGISDNTYQIGDSCPDRGFCDKDRESCLKENMLKAIEIVLKDEIDESYVERDKL